MRYAEQVAHTWRALLEAASASSSSMTDTDLDLALSGRRALLELLTAVGRELTETPASRGGLDLGDVAAHPVAALTLALGRHPRPAGRRSPTEVARVRADSPAGAAWQRVARHAVLAHHAWSAGAGRRLDPAVRWSGTQRVARLAEALSDLDAVLVRVAVTVGAPPAITSQLRAAAGAPLGIAARETLRLAAAVPADGPGPDRVAESAAAGMVSVGAPRDLPVAIRQVAVLLARLRQSSPERIAQIAEALARSTYLLTATGQHDPAAARLGQELLRHAPLLARVTAPGGVRALIPGDLRPVLQAAEAHRGARRFAGEVAGDPVLLKDSALAVVMVSRALAAASDRSVRGLHWFVPGEEVPADRPLWRALRPGDERVPAIVAAVHAAAGNAVLLARAAWAVGPSQPGVAGTGAEPALPPPGAARAAPAPGARSVHPRRSPGR